jgi:hypothetical protein
MTESHLCVLFHGNDSNLFVAHHYFPTEFYVLLCVWMPACWLECGLFVAASVLLEIILFEIVQSFNTQVALTDRTA